jgi:hypothetical protein
MNRLLAIGALVVAAALFPATAVQADNPGTQGQPNQSCQTVFPSGPLTPQGFNTAGFNHATTVYAGAQPQNSTNPHSVAQYDVACFQNGAHAGR